MTQDERQYMNELLERLVQSGKKVGRLTFEIERLKAENVKLRLMNGVDEKEFISCCDVIQSQRSNLKVVR